MDAARVALAAPAGAVAISAPTAHAAMVRATVMAITDVPSRAAAVITTAAAIVATAALAVTRTVAVRRMAPQTGHLADRQTARRTDRRMTRAAAKDKRAETVSGNAPDDRPSVKSTDYRENKCRSSDKPDRHFHFPIPSNRIA